MSIHVQTKAEIVYNDLKNKILKNLLPPGTRLVIRNLSKEYGTSDIPVREALKELTAEGLIETIPHVGSTVKEISYKTIKDMLEFRLLLEPIIAKLAIQRIDPVEIEDLKSLISAMQSKDAQSDPTLYAKLNRDFHSILLYATHNDYIIKAVTNLMQLEKRTQTIFNLFPETISQSLIEHKEILSCIQNKDLVGVEKISLEHKRRSFDKILAYYDKYYNK